MVQRGTRTKAPLKASSESNTEWRKKRCWNSSTKEAKQGWRLAVDAARITDEKASSEDREHTSGGVFVAIDSNLGAVTGKAEGSVTWTPGNEGILDQAWVNARGGM